MKTRVTINDMVYYAIQSLLVFFASVLVTKLLFHVTGQIDSHNILTLNGFCIPALIIGQYALPLAAQSLIFRNKPSEHYVEGKSTVWLKSGLKYILPGEAVRMLACMIPTALTAFGKLFSWPGMVLFTKTYMEWFPDRHAAIVEMHFRLVDFMGYASCHILTVIPYILMVMAVYGLLWKRRAEELKKMRSEKSAYSSNDTDRGSN